MEYPRAEVEDAIARLASAFIKAAAQNKWSWIADEFYHEHCVYTCDYGGSMRVEAHSRAEIKATHYGRDMDVGSGWAGWTFPILGWAVSGNEIISRWANRGPGLRPDGRHYETPGVSFITYGGAGKFSSQHDLFDIAHQMHLCDELDAAGLLSPRLKAEWVLPMKHRLIAMLSENLPPK